MRGGSPGRVSPVPSWRGCASYRVGRSQGDGPLQIGPREDASVTRVDTSAWVECLATQYADLGGVVRSRLKYAAVATPRAVVTGWGREMDEWVPVPRSASLQLCPRVVAGSVESLAHDRAPSIEHVPVAQDPLAPLEHFAEPFWPASTDCVEPSKFVAHWLHLNCMIAWRRPQSPMRAIRPARLVTLLSIHDWQGSHRSRAGRKRRDHGVSAGNRDIIVGYVQ